MPGLMRASVGVNIPHAFILSKVCFATLKQLLENSKALIFIFIKETVWQIIFLLV